MEHTQRQTSSTRGPASPHLASRRPLHPFHSPQAACGKAADGRPAHAQVGLGWSAAIGSGLVVARQEGGGWSPPSALSMYALGWGFQAGGALCDLLLVLHTKCALVLLERAGLNRQCTCCAAGRAL